MIVEKLVDGKYKTNTYIIICEHEKEALVVDPYVGFKNIYKAINIYSSNIKYIILTHAHWDHLNGLLDIYNNIQVPIIIHQGDFELFSKSIEKILLLNNQKMPNFKIYFWKEEIKRIQIGQLNGKLIHTPGHTKGSICILIDNIMLTGDTLFKEVIGRTDLEEGSYEDIIKSIKEKIMKYDNWVKILPGHGTQTSIGYERLNNKFIR